MTKIIWTHSDKKHQYKQLTDNEWQFQLMQINGSLSSIKSYRSEKEARLDGWVIYYEFDHPIIKESQVRYNLLNIKHYSPYCGKEGPCPLHWPRTVFKDGQFYCECGWKSEFPDDFIKLYREQWGYR
jgi:hypothetical protein